jgi:type IV pilus assembly protein PilE
MKLQIKEWQMRRQQGFSLMEVMVVVTIIGIISAVALPAYGKYVLETRRASATSCMTELAQFMERVYTGSMDYSRNNGAATVLPQTSCSIDLADFYTFSMNAGVQTYTLTAAPKGPQLKDTTCATLTLNQAGVRTAAGANTPAIVRKCWG